MAFIWSLGIQFNDIENAEKCKTLIEKIILSDQSEIKLFKYLQNKTESQYVLMFAPENMQLAGNEKLLSNPYFYEIQNQFYQFIFDLELAYEVALFGFEGADRILDDVIDYINEYGLEHDMNNIDIHVQDSINIGEKYFDGLVISDNEYERLDNKHKIYFENFKPSYKWLPIKTAANSSL